MRNVSIISVLAVLAFAGVFNCPAASAQSRTCSLVLNISTLDENGQAKEVKNARAFVVRKSTRRRIPARLISGSPQFSALRAGNYRLTVLKRGFKSTTRGVEFSCTPINSKIEVAVSLERTTSFQESIASIGETQLVRKELVTTTGSEAPRESNFPRNQPDIAQPLKPISGGVLNGKAIELPKPAYPPIARQAHASGTVLVQVTIDETGNIISAHALSGHPLLQSVCVEAARKSKFSPTKLAGQPVKVTGVISYNFVAE